MTKCHQKSIKKQSKINQKSIKNRPKLDFGRFWVPKALLEASWVRLGPKIWPTWTQLGSNLRFKTEPKSIPKSIKILMPLEIEFWNDFGGFREPKWNQVGSKIGTEIDTNFEKRFFQKALKNH